ncbi:unnamed protein product, partial [Polarella glacialis]
AEAVVDASQQALLIDTSQADQPFDGIGAISGGGATSRLLVDYPEPQRSQVLDYLFKPNYGASLQILKVEIGGDSQSTDGTESSHMHSEDDLDYHRGYEWWLLSEAKKRNPEIKTYGLPWAFPGWVGGAKGSDPFKRPDLTSKYMVKWLEGARDVYGIDIDYLGIWNERSSDASYVKTLRKTLNDAGFGKTTLVAKDGDSRICDDMMNDKEYQAAVGVVGLHYPSDFDDYSNCRKLGYGVKGGKPLWASEESSSYDDINGAACWARVITSHWVLQGMTSSIMWNLVGSYFHGTEWYASSLLTAVEPWGGHFNTPEVLWATAHITQFTKVGWNLLKVGAGSGELPNGGYYTTYADPKGRDWSLTIVKIDSDHAACTRPPLPSFKAENVTFQLAPGTPHGSMAVWYSNFEEFAEDGTVPTVFDRLADVPVLAGGQFTIEVKVGAFYTISTIQEGPTKGVPATPIPASQPSMPLPYSDDYEGYKVSQEGKWWSDQIGAFEVHYESGSAGNKVMRQMVPQLPIGWSDHGSNGPVSLMGMREWQDITLEASFKLPQDSGDKMACLGSRVDQSWNNGIVLCVSASGAWRLSVGGPKLGGIPSGQVYASGQVAALPGETMSCLSLTTVRQSATGSLALGPCKSKSTSPRAPLPLFTDVAIRGLDAGFAALGASDWVAVEFDDVSIHAAGDRWQPRGGCAAAAAGAAVKARPCETNGLAAEDQTFDLIADWGIRHLKSGLCVSASSLTAGSGFVLAECHPDSASQQLRNDYTRVRNENSPFVLRGSSGELVLAGAKDGSVTTEPQHTKAAEGSWNSWAYFPNTRQLRNQYVAIISLGYPMCLSACGAAEDVAKFVL